METKVIKMTPITDVFGITFWRLDRPGYVPAFEVYKVMAYDPNSGMYWFRSMRDRTLHSRNHYQLDRNGFHPFCYPNKEKV
jgi:hypothetical protein